MWFFLRRAGSRSSLLFYACCPVYRVLVRGVIDVCHLICRCGAHHRMSCLGVIIVVVLYQKKIVCFSFGTLTSSFSLIKVVEHDVKAYLHYRLTFYLLYKYTGQGGALTLLKGMTDQV